MSARTVRVAAVQMASANGAVEVNLARAEGLVEDAAAQGAELILLPEFMPSGYIFDTSMWDAAEPKEGPTLRWLRRVSKQRNAWVGTSYLEAEGEDFYNTFALVNPDGEVAGTVRKQTPASFEAYFTRGEPGPHMIDTAFGRVGVGICYENQLAYLPRLMFEHSADLLIMPHSAPLPRERAILFPRKQYEYYHAVMKGLAAHYARLLGIPAVMINKCGPWVSPLPGVPRFRERSSFPGLSTIADSDGKVKASLQAEEGVIVSDVRLVPSRKTDRMPATYGRWSMNHPRGMNLLPLVEALGAASYRRSAERKRRAHAVSSGC